MRAYDGIKAERGREVKLETPDFLEQARDFLSKGLRAEIRMSGSSMRPTIEDGDIIIVSPIEDQFVKQGDIVLIQTRFETAVIHRIVRIERGAAEKVVVTRGDAALQSDAPVALSKVLGRVELIERAGESVTLNQPRETFTQWLQATLRRLRLWPKK